MAAIPTALAISELATNKRGGITARNLINEKSATAALLIKGFYVEALKHNGDTTMSGYDGIGTILFVNSHSQKDII